MLSLLMHTCSCRLLLLPVSTLTISLSLSVMSVWSWWGEKKKLRCPENKIILLVLDCTDCLWSFRNIISNINLSLFHIFFVVKSLPFIPFHEIQNHCYINFVSKIITCCCHASQPPTGLDTYTTYYHQLLTNRAK